MIRTRRQLYATALSTALLATLVAGVVLLGAAVGPVAGDEHTREEAADFTDEANFTVDLPFATDHYPGDQNAENGSIQYFASGEEAFNEVTDEEGVFLDSVVIDADWIDYSACNTDNTYVFGIDRGNDNPGTQIDQDAIDRMESNNFHDSGLEVNFYTHEDFANDPPYMEANDAIVAEQGARSSAGACLTMTTEPGWYQLQGFINGTEADNGPEEQPSEDANEAGINAQSNYVYVCECDSREEAEEQLGPAPDDASADQEDGGTADADQEGESETDASDEQQDDESGQDDQTGQDGSDGQEASTGQDEPDEQGAEPGSDDADPAQEDADQQDGEPGDGPTDSDDGAGGEGAGGQDAGTPTPGDGPGFGAVAGVVALLAGGLYATRRE